MKSSSGIGGDFYVLTVSGALLNNGQAVAADMVNALIDANAIKQWVPVHTGSLSAGTVSPSITGTFGLTGTDGVPVQLAISGAAVGTGDVTVYRRFTTITTGTATGDEYLQFVVNSPSITLATTGSASGSCKLSFIVGTQLNQVTGKLAENMMNTAVRGALKGTKI